MELKLVKTTHSGLDSGARCILALRNQPFCFLWYRGHILMNREMKGIRKMTAAIETLWKYDYVADDEIMAEIDAALETIAQIAGKVAADQILDAWGTAAEESRKDRAKVAALEWIDKEYETMSDEAWDEIYAAGYSSDFVREGLWRAFSQLNDDHPDTPRYRRWINNAINAACVYGFQLAQKATHMEAVV